MTEQEEEALARKTLQEISDKVKSEIDEVIQYKVNDSINTGEVVASEKFATNTVLSWYLRIIIESLADNVGREGMGFILENVYYQIAAQKLGSDDFAEKYRPASVQKRYDEWNKQK